MIEGVQRKTLLNNNPSIFYGYVVVPFNVVRDDFVETAYRKEKISVLVDQGGGMIHDCYITKQALREIIFPLTNQELGSGVICVCNRFNNKPFVVGVVSKEDETDLFEEYGINFSQTFGNNSVSFNGNAKNGEITINVSSLSAASSLLLNCVGQTNSRIKINCNGSFFATIDNTINFNAGNEINFISQNGTQTNVSSVNITNNNVNIKPNERLNIGNGSQPIPKGEELTTQLDVTNNYLSTLVRAIEVALITIDSVVASGSAGNFSSTMSATSPGDYKNVNSEISYTD